MPQLDVFTYLNQATVLIIVFTIFYGFVKQILFPMIIEFINISSTV